MAGRLPAAATPAAAGRAPSTAAAGVGSGGERHRLSYAGNHGNGGGDTGCSGPGAGNDGGNKSNGNDGGGTGLGVYTGLLLKPLFASK
jgi:hypothetical protein